MLGGLGNLTNLIKQAKGIKERMEAVQIELANRRFEAESGAGMVKATVNGKFEVISLKIDPSSLGDRELLEDLIKSAMNLAIHKAQDGAREELAKVTGGMNLPGLSDMLGGG